MYKIDLRRIDVLDFSSHIIILGMYHGFPLNGETIIKFLFGFFIFIFYMTMLLQL